MFNRATAHGHLYMFGDLTSADITSVNEAAVPADGAAAQPTRA
jgi:hypothetical protein